MKQFMFLYFLVYKKDFKKDFENGQNQKIILYYNTKLEFFSQRY